MAKARGGFGNDGVTKRKRKQVKDKVGVLSSAQE